jgi:hypothetical protein
MELGHVTYFGPPVEQDGEVLAALPRDLIALLEQINGFIVSEGGLHVRGVCSAPPWHSLRSVLFGKSALHKLYPVLLATDIPFAQDCVADQFMLRERLVWKLQSETGDLIPMELTLSAFLEAVESNPIEFLGMQPLLRYQREGGSLQPGQVLSVYPPFCTAEAANGVSLRAVPVGQAISFLAEFARSISSIGDGEKFEVKIVP